MGRLIEERYDFGNNGFGDAEDFITEYAFDLASNRVQKTVDQQGNGSVDETIAYRYDANDRLETEILDDLTAANADRNTRYKYNGTTQIGKTVRAGTVLDTGTLRERSTYAYNAQGRMESTRIETYDAGGTPVSDVTSSYLYNSDGIRVRQTVDDGEENSRLSHRIDRHKCSILELSVSSPLFHHYHSH